MTEPQKKHRDPLKRAADMRALANKPGQTPERRRKALRLAGTFEALARRKAAKAKHEAQQGP